MVHKKKTLQCFFKTKNDMKVFLWNKKVNDSQSYISHIDIYDEMEFETCVIFFPVFGVFFYANHINVDVCKEARNRFWKILP